MVASQAKPLLLGHNNIPHWSSTEQLIHMACQLCKESWAKLFGPDVGTEPSLLVSGVSMRFINTIAIVWQP